MDVEDVLAANLGLGCPCLGLVVLVSTRVEIQQESDQDTTHGQPGTAVAEKR